MIINKINNTMSRAMPALAPGLSRQLKISPPYIGIITVYEVDRGFEMDRRGFDTYEL